MRQYDMSLRRKGAVVTLQDAQTYLEKMYGLEDEAVSDAHFLMMTCIKEVVRGARSYSYTPSFYTYWKPKPEIVKVPRMSEMEKLTHRVRRFFNLFTLWSHGYCTKHLKPKQYFGKSRGSRYCAECRTEQIKQTEQNLKRIVTEVKYGV